MRETRARERERQREEILLQEPWQCYWLIVFKLTGLEELRCHMYPLPPPPPQPRGLFPTHLWSWDPHRMKWSSCCRVAVSSALTWGPLCRILPLLTQKRGRMEHISRKQEPALFLRATSVWLAWSFLPLGLMNKHLPIAVLVWGTYVSDPHDFEFVSGSSCISSGLGWGLAPA
jgi:hypothetical protein